MRGENPLPHTRRVTCVKSLAHPRYQGGGEVRWTLPRDGAVVATRWTPPLPGSTKRWTAAPKTFRAEIPHMPTPTPPKTPKANGTITSTTGQSSLVTRDATNNITASIDAVVTANTRNRVTAVPPLGDPVTPVTVNPANAHQPRPPSRGLTARTSSLHLRDAIYERSLRLVDRFRVIRTIDIAAWCFPERPFKAALTAAQRAVRGMVKQGLLRRYKTDRFQTVYGLTQRGVDWVGEHGYEAASSVRRVSDMTNPEHRLWAQFLVICARARGLRALTESELLHELNIGAQKAIQGYITVAVRRGDGTARKCLRPDAVAFEKAGLDVIWFEVDRSKRGSERQADLVALIQALGRKTADGKTLRQVVVQCKTERIERDAIRLVEQLAAAGNGQVLTEGRRHIRCREDGVYDVWAAVPYKHRDGRVSLSDDCIGHIVVQMLPTWLPKVRVDATNRWSMDGWFEVNYLPCKLPPARGRWELPVSPLVRMEEGGGSS